MLMYIQMEMDGKGTRQMYTKLWEVECDWSAGEKTLCSYTCIIYALYIELVVMYTFIIKKKRKMGKHNS